MIGNTIFSFPFSPSSSLSRPQPQQKQKEREFVEKRREEFWASFTLVLAGKPNSFLFDYSSNCNCQILFSPATILYNIIVQFQFTHTSNCIYYSAGGNNIKWLFWSTATAFSRPTARPDGFLIFLDVPPLSENSTPNGHFWQLLLCYSLRHFVHKVKTKETEGRGMAAKVYEKPIRIYYNRINLIPKSEPQMCPHSII